MSLLLRRGILSSQTGFTPADIATLGWWDASDTATITEVSGAVSQLDDKSGNAEHLVQATASDKPTTGTRTQNSLNVLDCDGHDFLAKTSFPVPASGDIVFYGVFGSDVINSGSDSIFSLSGANDFQFEAGNPTDFRAELQTTGIGSTITAFASSKNGPSVYKSVFDFSGAVQFSIFVDGVENPDGPNTYTSKLSASQTLRVMSNRANTAWPDGFFAEMVIVEAADSRIDDYLKNKWGTP